MKMLLERMRSRLRGQLRPASDYTLEVSGCSVLFRKVLVFWVSSRSSEAELIENVFHHKLAAAGYVGTQLTRGKGQ
jgi:hypothetical protein